MGRKCRLNEGQIAQCVRLYRAGMSIQRIARRYAVHPNSMHGILVRRVEIRSQSKIPGPVDQRAKIRNAMQYAFRSGHLVRKAYCEECGARYHHMGGQRMIQAHHDDYNEPLAVRWLCQGCHIAWHDRHEPVLKK